jgi:hypothetical protein
VANQQQPPQQQKPDGWGSSDGDDSGDAGSAPAAAAAAATAAERADATDSSDDGGFGPAPATRARGRGTNQLGGYAKRGGRGGMLGFGMTSLAGADGAGTTGATGAPSSAPAFSQPTIAAGSDSDDDIGDTPAIGVLSGLRGRGGARPRGKTSARGGAARLASLAKPAEDSDDDW